MFYYSMVFNYVFVAFLQNSPLVGRNESGIIPVILNFNLLLFCLLISMLINIVVYVSTAVLCSKTYLKVFFFYNKFIETRLRLVGKTMCDVISWEIIDIDTY